jgi:hypothetical protein
VGGWDAVQGRVEAIRRRQRCRGAAALGPRRSRLLTVKIRQPSHEFTFGVGMSVIPYPLVLTPVV